MPPTHKRQNNRSKNQTSRTHGLKYYKTKHQSTLEIKFTWKTKPCSLQNTVYLLPQNGS
jgi:hypothetical protein